MHLQELLEVGQEIRLNPYVTQMEKLSNSLKYLTKTFREKVENDETYQLEERQVCMIQNQIKEKMCNHCKEANRCKTSCKEAYEQFMDTLFQEIEEYGAELSIQKKRELEKQCYRFDDLKEEVLRNIWMIKNNRMWTVRMMQSQDASLIAMQAFVEAVEESTKEIDASMVQDIHLERKISAHLKRVGVRTLKVVLFVSHLGKYEVHITAKGKEGACVSTSQMARIISGVIGRSFLPEKKERFVLKESYSTVIFMEKPRYQTLYGVAHTKKQGSEISGDNFLIVETPGGKTSAMLSDGMGSGASAYKKSKILLELAEKLLEANISPKLMIQMINAALITEVRELEFATLDMCIVDIYQGEIEIIKAGASATYIVTPKECRCFQASTLPIGVLADSEINHYRYKLEADSYIVMVTDGVNEAIKETDKKAFIYRLFQNAKTKNAKELATYFLDEVVGLQKELLKDDMMVLVLGVWELQF